MLSQLYLPFQHWSEKGAIWLYSDTHFGDKELMAGTPGRPNDEEQLALINSRVGKHDTIILLGDIGSTEYAKRIKGYKVLICGNHDYGHTKYEKIFNEVYQGPLIIGEKIILSHEPIYGIDWALNIHGHVHKKSYTRDKYHLNVCSDHIQYTPISLNYLIKHGELSGIETIHRKTIDKATKKKKDSFN